MLARRRLSLPVSLVMIVAGPACSPDEISSSTGSGSETASDPDTDSETTDAPLGEPCFLELQTGYAEIWEQQFAWGELVVVNRRLGELIVGEGDEWFVGDPGWFASSFWGTSASELFLASTDVHIWDGQADSVVLESVHDSVASVTPSGEIWLATHNCNNCPGRVLRWTGEMFEDIEAPPLDAEIRGLVATDDDRRWVIDDDLFIASQIADAAWVEEGQVPELGPSYLVALFRGDGQGGLWLVANDNASDDETRLLHRDSQGVWSWASYDTQYSIYNVSVAALDDGLYLFDDVDQSLHRWDGFGAIEPVTTLPGFNLIFGGPDRLLGVDLSHGQAIVEIEPGPQPSLTTLWEVTGVAPSQTTSAVSLDAVYELDRASLRRWNDGWTYLADSSVSADPESGFFGLWAESAEVAWVSEVVDEGSPRTRLWRWQTDALVPVEHEIDPSVGIRGLWGSSAERLFGWGLDPLGLASIWFYDGQSWSSVPLPSPTFVPSQVTGDADTMFVVDELGQLYAWDGEAWSQLPSAPATALVDHELVWTGELLFYRHHAADAFVFLDESRAYVLDGDGWVGIYDKWPDGPPTEDADEISSDGAGGLWLLRLVAQEDQLYHFDGTAWTSIMPEAPVEALERGPITGAPEGVIVHGDRNTQQYRWACD